MPGRVADVRVPWRDEKENWSQHTPRSVKSPSCSVYPEHVCCPLCERAPGPDY